MTVSSPNNRFPAAMLAAALLLVMAAMACLPAARAESPEAQQRREQLMQQKGSLQQNINVYRQKKQEAQQKAEQHRQQWWQAQKQLEEKQRSLTYHEKTRDQTINNMVYLDQKLGQTEDEALRLSDESAQRMRSLYMGERTSLLQMILEAKDISTLLDRIYYKKKIVEQDKTLLESLKSKMGQIKDLKGDLAQEKVLLDKSIQTIQVQKQVIAQTSQTHHDMMEKYMHDADTYERMENELLRESASITAEIRNLYANAPHVAAAGSTGRFMWPIHGAITSGFGYRTHPLFHRRLFHTGLDIAGPNGTPIAAADGGVVIFAGWKGGYGKAVMINHGFQNGHNYVTLYGHMSGIAVSVGQNVGKGQVIGYEGMTGYATGPHVHFEIRIDGSPVDPTPYL